MYKGIVLGFVLGALLMIAWPTADARSTTSSGVGEFDAMQKQRDELSRERRALKHDTHPEFWVRYYERRIEYAERMLTVAQTPQAAEFWNQRAQQFWEPLARARKANADRVAEREAAEEKAGSDPQPGGK